MNFKTTINSAKIVISYKIEVAYVHALMTEEAMVDGQQPAYPHVSVTQGNGW